MIAYFAKQQHKLAQPFKGSVPHQDLIIKILYAVEICGLGISGTGLLYKRIPACFSDT